MIFCGQHGDRNPAFHTMVDADGKKWLACPLCRPEWKILGAGNMDTSAFLARLEASAQERARVVEREIGFPRGDDDA